MAHLLKYDSVHGPYRGTIETGEDWIDVGFGKIMAARGEEAFMSMTGPLGRAARALVQWPRAHVARVAGLEEEALTHFEAGRSVLGDLELARLQDSLERGGAVFIAEDHTGGLGVRLKLNTKDVRAINRMEGEGGPWHRRCLKPSRLTSALTGRLRTGY